MLEAVIEAAPGGTTGFTLVAFLVAITALWRTLQGAHQSRIAALESAVDACMEKHEECERHNSALSIAIIDLAENRDGEAIARCRQILAQRREETTRRKQR